MATGGGPCVNLQCEQHDCPGGVTTTISGTVYDPAGTQPALQRRRVRAERAGRSRCRLAPRATRATACTRASRSPRRSRIAAGKFTLENAPDGANIPLVVQVGKWRRQFTIAERGAVPGQSAAGRDVAAAAQPHRGRHPEHRDLDRHGRHARVPAAARRRGRQRVRSGRWRRGPRPHLPRLRHRRPGRGHGLAGAARRAICPRRPTPRRPRRRAPSRCGTRSTA